MIWDLRRDIFAVFRYETFFLVISKWMAEGE